MTTTRSTVFVASAALFAALPGVVAPIAYASPLDGIRAAVNAARSGSPCGPLNYNIDLEGNAQALVGNRSPGVPPAGRYNGKTAEGDSQEDPTAEAIRILIDKMRPLITNCSYKDFGVGMVRNDDREYSVVSLALGEPPAAAPAPVPVPEQRPIKCTGGGTVPAGQTCPPKPPAAPVEQAPTNAVTLDIRREGVRAKVTVGNTSNLRAQCTYNAKEVLGLGIPISRDFEVNPKGTTPLEFAAPLPGQTYTVVVACSADFNGKNVEIGRVQQDFSSF
ncbi:hypothetical protein HZU38_03335 [Mycolicibacterium vanbaalenii]|uniref:hypothetical protein n=1 Tax=Mycolicibacterium vanbaalenii TaxID=110539 RepID=UPI001F25FB9C|nr:hypothetical protein [Mycolicibacterium vanbaalenii]UJL29570.1 hypothetical protein HZU38_03335 [Mycolicibacterium vanbaalenii]WND57391.1 hypothetical protein QQA43_02940 [Mycolicibacterium vanbaalenii]